MITLIGVGHVFDLRNQVREIILQKSPSVVCLELDQARFNALLTKTSSRRVPFPYATLAFIQQWIARKYGTDVGGEMLVAAQSAKDIGARIEFIDMNTSSIFYQFWDSMTFLEKVKLLLGSLTFLFIGKESVEREVANFQADSKGYLEAFGKEFPSIKRVLIDERNNHMANAIRELNQKHESIVAIVGDGHVEGLQELLRDLPLETIRLKELREGTYKGDHYSISYEFEP